MKKTDLSSYNNEWYDTRASRLKMLLWFAVNAFLLINPLNPISSLKVFVLRLFGARIGKRVTIKPSVNIKYPWLLEVGDHVWIGENVWIDNLVKIKIGSNSVLSQGAMLLTGNHDYRKTTFDLMLGEIILEDGVWIGAKSIVTPGIVCRSHSVLAVNSVASADLEAYSIYRGNPAVKVKQRVIDQVLK